MLFLNKSNTVRAVVAGLGNPGRQYEHTRHNMGFDTVDRIGKETGIAIDHLKFHAMYGTGKLGQEKIVLMKPLSYMNLSGGPVCELLHFYKVQPETGLIVVCDDIDLEPGRLRIRKGGSAGGHNGLKDIIARLGTDSFIRVRIGVGAKPPGWDLADYVLSSFNAADREIVDESIARAARAVGMILTDGVDAAMNEYNRRK